MPSRRRSRHPFLRFIADRRLWLAGLVVLVFAALVIVHYISWMTAAVCAVVAALVVVIVGEWVHLQLSIERSLRRFTHSDSDERLDREAS